MSVDPWGAGDAPHREKMERASKEIIRRVKLEAHNDAGFVPTASDASTILAARRFVLPPVIPERASNDAGDVLASRVFSRPDATASQGTPLNIAGRLVQRDGAGDFAAGVVQAIAIKATAGTDFEIQDAAGGAVVLINEATNAVSIENGNFDVPLGDVTLGQNLDVPAGDVVVGGNVTAGQFIGDLTGNADTATALAGAPINVTGSIASGAAFLSLKAALVSLGLITDSTTP